MNVIEKNEGRKLPCEVVGTKLSLGGEMTLDLAKYERDYPVCLDICQNRDGILVVGVSDYYVAQLEIPERLYDQEVVVLDDVETINQTAVPFDMERVTLTIWALN